MLVILAKGVRIFPPTRMQKPQTVGQQIAKLRNCSISSVVHVWNIGDKKRMNQRGSLTKLGKIFFANEKVRLGLSKNASTAQYNAAYEIDFSKRMDKTMEKIKKLKEQYLGATQRQDHNFIVNI